MTIRNYSNTAAGATLTASIGATDTAIPLSTITGDPTVPFTAALARGTANEEIVLVTAVIGTTATVTRGYDGTSAKAQSAGTTFQEVVVALDFREANAHVNTTAGAHGTASPLVGVSDAQTLTNKTLTSPAISNPTVTGTATMPITNVTTLNVSGVSALTGATTVGGLLTASGGITVPTGNVVTVTDAPTAGTSAANKSYVDGKTWPTSALSDAASAATPSVAIKRDSAGRAQVVDPAAAADIATKNYVDTRTTDTGWVSLTPAGAFGAGGFYTGYRTIGGMCTLLLSLNGGDATTTGQALTLPAGATPAHDVYGLGENSGYVVAELVVGSNGAVTVPHRVNTSLGISSLLAAFTYPVGP